jgi:hypothetical protein
MKILGMIALLLGVAGAAMAQPPPVPEVGVESGASAVALLFGALLVIGSYRKK